MTVLLCTCVQPNTCSQPPSRHLPSPPCHRIPSCPPSTTFNPSIFSCLCSPLHLPPSVQQQQQPLFCYRGREGKRREGQAFTSPLPPAIISLICTPLPPPSLPLFAFDIQHLVQAAVSEQRRQRRAELKHDAELSTPQPAEPCVSAGCSPALLP